MKHLFRKVGMISAFSEDGLRYPLTVLKICQAHFDRFQTLEDGRQQILVSYYSDQEKKKKRPLMQKGWFFSSEGTIEPDLTPSFDKKSFVTLTGRCKGRGFQGVMKRHGFAGGPTSHGSRFHRRVGSVGMRTEPGKTPKGQKMPGRMGARQFTQKRQEVFHWDAEKGLLALVGPVPGSKGSLVLVGNYV